VNPTGGPCPAELPASEADKTLDVFVGWLAMAGDIHGAVGEQGYHRSAGGLPGKATSL
jgi:hypothetical protein